MLLSVHAVLQILAKRRGPKILVLVTFTRPQMLKRNRRTREPNPHVAGVERRCERFGLIGVDYRNAVNNQRAREGQPVDVFGDLQYFRAKSLWNGSGEHVPGSPFLVRHKTKLTECLAFMPQPAGNDVKLGIDRWFDVATGMPVDRERVIDLLRKPSDNRKHQRIKRQVSWRTIPLESIIQIRCGEIYDIIPYAQARVA